MECKIKGKNNNNNDVNFKRTASENTQHTDLEPMHTASRQLRFNRRVPFAFLCKLYVCALSHNGVVIQMTPTMAMATATAMPIATMVVMIMMHVNLFLFVQTQFNRLRCFIHDSTANVEAP